MQRFLGLCIALLTVCGLALGDNAPAVPFYSVTPDGLPWSGREGNLDQSCPCDACFDCPNFSRFEGEFVPNYNDHYNSGCNDTDGTPSFINVHCGETICGTSFTRVYVRDSDWYQLVIPADEPLVGPPEICFAVNFEARFAVFRPGPNGCADMTVVSGPHDVDPCDTLCVGLPTAPGTYWIYIAYEAFGCPSTGSYILWIDCETEELFPPQAWDMGDLPQCAYPTLPMNPAHGITGVAWLGAGISADTLPKILDHDEFDDGVTYNNTPWLPCTPVSVTVTVTAGPNYAAWADSADHPLFLSGWKDGNLDGDFCDILCDTVPEWIVRDAPVTPGQHTFTFIDPGVFELGRYDGRFRWRLSNFPLGRFGAGQDDGPCANCGTVDSVVVGEVEDYILDDIQLAVELLGGLAALSGDGRVMLTWTTASERNNDRFEILRDGIVCGWLPGAGTSGSRHDYRFVDENLVNGRAYAYTLVAVDASGARDELAAASAMPEAAAGVVTEYALYQNYPNPFNPTTGIRFDLLESGFVTLKVYDVMGRELATLVSGDLAAGSHAVSFDAHNLPSGTYLYRLEAGRFVQTRKMLLMK